MIKKTMIAFLMLVAFGNVYAQLDNNLKAKLYFAEAEKTYNQGDFSSSLEYIEKAETTLGTTVARILALKIKVYYAQGWFSLAKKEIDDYTANYMQQASQDLNDEILALYINIEEAVEAAEKEAKRRKAAAVAAAAEERRIEKEKLELIRSQLIKVRGGTFTMGWKRSNKDEQPIHEVTLTDFYMSKTEVTVAQYRSYCKDTGVDMPSEPSWGWNSSDPIVEVFWHDAMNYCKWLSEKLGINITLPTEAQWEFAARGGNQSKGYGYAGGFSIETVGWYQNGKSNRPHTVATKRANELGLYDMAGNVAEWCLDWYDRDYYRRSPSKNPINTTPGYEKVLRGGSWRDYAAGCSVSHRKSREPYDSDPGYGYIGIGFRVVSF